MHLTLRRLGGFIGLVLFFCHPGFAVEESEVEAAIDRGLAWVAVHPAGSGDGGFPDLVDEALFYVMIERLTADQEPGLQLRRAFEQCISRLEQSLELKRWLKKPDKTLIEHYHLLLATHLMGSVQRPMSSQARIVREAQRTLSESRFENPTFRLTVALLLQHLGATPRVSMDELLDASLVNRVALPGAEASPGQLVGRSPFPRLLAYYALIHEVAALTDFGRLPAPVWLMERRGGVARILREGARVAMESGQVDLLAEILLCHHMLGLPVTGALGVGVDFLLATQRADGTWGEQATPRSSRVRHAVLTATAALLASGLSTPR